MITNVGCANIGSQPVTNVNETSVLYFDFENELLNDYDAISTNQDKKLNIFNFEKPNSNHDNYKIFQFKNGNNVLNINGIINKTIYGTKDILKIS